MNKVINSIFPGLVSRTLPDDVSQLSWLEKCRPTFGSAAEMEHWDQLATSLSGSTFVKHVDPAKGMAIIKSMPVQANTENWIDYLDIAAAKRTRLAVAIAEEKLNPVATTFMKDMFPLMGKPPALAGGTRNSTKRVRAIAQVMRKENGFVNSAWVAQIMNACCIRASDTAHQVTSKTYTADRVRKALK